MAKFYHKESIYILRHAESFMYYLQHEVLGIKALKLLEAVSKQTDVYIFSGVIRNYLLGFTENRDCDVVISHIKSLTLKQNEIDGCVISRNSFGGYKIQVENLSIDAWGLEMTWGLLQNNMRFTPHSLIKTAFFNFSSIAFDYNHKRFIFDDAVCAFLRTRAMDVVFPDNPNKTLCVLNTIYYAKKYGFNVAYGLCKWIGKNYQKDMPFDEVQYVHFHKKVISDDDREWFINTISFLLQSNQLKKNKMLYFDFVQRRVDILYIMT